MESQYSSGPEIQRLQIRILSEDNFFALLALSSRRSGDFSLGFCAGKPLGQIAHKRLKIIAAITIVSSIVTMSYWALTIQ